MAIKPVAPTMSTAGFLADPEGMMQFLFYCFLASSRSQSNLFSIYSLPAIIADHSADNEEVTQVSEVELNRLFRGYFEKTAISVKGGPYQDKSHKDDGLWILKFNITVYQDNVPYVLERLVEKTPDDDLNIITQH